VLASANHFLVDVLGGLIVTGLGWIDRCPFGISKFLPNGPWSTFLVGRSRSWCTLARA
jgi:hypothetical protein